MKSELSLILALAMAATVHGQTLKKYPVENTGCSLYTYCGPLKFDLDMSEDSSKVYTAQCSKEDVTYGIICIQLLQQMPDPAGAEQVMISYLDYLKLNFDIVSAAGYGKGQTLTGRDDVRGVVDYWTDKLKNNWKIKAWTDGKFIGVLFAYSQKELPVSKVDLYLMGFRFPGM